MIPKLPVKKELCKIYTWLYSRPFFINYNKKNPTLLFFLTPTLLKWIRAQSFTWCRALEPWLSAISPWHTSRAKVSLAMVCGACGILFLRSSRENCSRNVIGIRLSAVIISWHIVLTCNVFSLCLATNGEPWNYMHEVTFRLSSFQEEFPLSDSLGESELPH